MDIERIAPELRAAARKIPHAPVRTALGRALMQGVIRRMPKVAVDGVRIEVLDGVGQGLRLYHPAARRTDGALFWIHGGGYVIGRAVMDEGFCARTAAQLGLTIVSVEYRLAPRHPFPAGLDDCLVGWDWLQANVPSLGLDARRIAVGGMSAGGGLAASLVQRVHDRGEVPAAGQWLLSPMLDDRTAARRDLPERHFIWDNRCNAYGWRAYLKARPGAPEVPRYAAPARREDLRGLPPAWIGVGDIDLFHEESRTYAARLTAGGVAATLAIVPGAPHGFEVWGAATPLVREHMAGAQRWLGDAVG
jgi:acetyl esterase/lipase